MGTYTFNKNKSRKYKHNSRLHEEKIDIVVKEDTIPPIISKATWNKSIEIRNANREVSGSNKAYEPYLLTGIIKCGACGSSMSGNGRKPAPNRSRVVTYRCCKKHNYKDCVIREIGRDVIERFILKEIAKHFLNPEYVAVLLAEVKDLLKEKDKNSLNEVKVLEKTLISIEKQEDNLVNAIAENGVNKALSTKLDALSKEKENIEQAIRTLTEAEEKSPYMTLSEADIIAKLRGLSNNIQTSDRNQLKLVVREYVEKVTIYSDYVEVVFKFPYIDTSTKKLTETPLSSDL